jgi:hypothetical protein
MRNPLVVLSIATSLGLVLAMASNPEPGGKVAAGLARGVIGGVILGSNPWAPLPIGTQARLQFLQTDDGFFRSPYP